MVNRWYRDKLFSIITEVFDIFHLQRFKKERSCSLHTYNDCECHSHMFTRPIFQKNCLWRFKKEGSFTRRMTLSAIFICFQGIFSKKFTSGSIRRNQVAHLEWLWVSFSYVYKVYFSKRNCLWRFKKKASYTLAMTLTVRGILICLQDLFFKKFHLQRFKKERSCTLIMTVSAILICLQGLFFKKIASGSLRRKEVSHEEWLWVPFSYVYKAYFWHFMVL